MHQRGIEIMRDFPLVLEMNYNLPVWKLILEYFDFNRKDMPHDGPLQFQDKPIWWSIRDCDMPHVGGWYIFFKDISTQMSFKLRYG